MLEEKIAEQLKQSLKSGDKVRLSVMRMIVSEIKNKKIADIVKTLDDDIIVALIQKMARQHNESIEQFKQGNRDDLVKKETEELAILEEYLPKQLSEEEISNIVSEAIKETGAVSAKDMGKVMGVILGRVKGCADGRVVSKMVKDRLV